MTLAKTLRRTIGTIGSLIYCLPYKSSGNRNGGKCRLLQTFFSGKRKMGYDYRVVVYFINGVCNQFGAINLAVIIVIKVKIERGSGKVIGECLLYDHAAGVLIRGNPVKSPGMNRVQEVI